mgnify:CR=1 FL=1
MGLASREGPDGGQDARAGIEPIGMKGATSVSQGEGDGAAITSIPCVFGAHQEEQDSIPSGIGEGELAATRVYQIWRWCHGSKDLPQVVLHKLIHVAQPPLPLAFPCQIAQHF